MTCRRSIGSAVLVAILSCSASAAAQSDFAVSEAALREPWDRQLAVLQSVSGSITAAGAPLGDTLTLLQVTLGEFEVQVDRLIDRVIGDAQFVYVAAETSQELAAQLAEIHARFDALYAALKVRERADVRAAQEALDTLRKLLQDKRHFERDVVRAFGAGTRQQRIDLATRWWIGEERAIEVKRFVAALRAKVEG
jgi:hypothetical protein